MTEWTIHPDLQMKPGEEKVFTEFMGSVGAGLANSPGDIHKCCHIPEDVSCRVVIRGEMVIVGVRPSDVETVRAAGREWEKKYAKAQKPKVSWWEWLVGLLVFPVVFALIVGGGWSAVVDWLINPIGGLSWNASLAFTRGCWVGGIIGFLGCLSILLGKSSS